MVINMDMKDILEEAQLAVEMISEELADIFLPTDEMEMCKRGVLPENHYLVKKQLSSASNRIRQLIIKVDKWKDALDKVEHGELFFKRHMVDMKSALRGLQQDIFTCTNFIRDQTRRPLVIPEKKWYLKREGEE
jgi:hypothetical protein